MADDLAVAVSIPTHNRKGDLERTLQQLGRLNPAPQEIIIGADNCTDGTIEYVKENFSHCKLLVNDSALGSIGTRHRIIHSTEADIILSLDDDSYPVEEDFIARLVELFHANPDVGLVAFPQKSDEFPSSLTQSDFGPDLWIGSCANSGMAFRRELYLSLPGYPVFFFHAYEEPDFALQVWGAGKRVLFFTGLCVRHHWTPVLRNEVRIHQRHARNEFLSIVLRCPLVLIVPVALFRVLRQLGYAYSRGWGWLFREPAWWVAALPLLWPAVKSRKPVSLEVYWEWLKRIRKPQIADFNGSI